MIANSQQRRRSTFETRRRQEERASTSNFCFATNQNNPHILKYVSYDRSRLLQPCGKLFSWAPPVPLGNFYNWAPPPPRNFHWPSVGGGGMDIFWNHTLQRLTKQRSEVERKGQKAIGKKIYIKKQQQNKTNKTKRKKERVLRLRIWTQHLQLDATFPYHYSTKDDYVSLVKSH